MALRIRAVPARADDRWRRRSWAASPAPPPQLATPNIEFHVQPLSLDQFGEPLHRFPAFTATVCNLRPESRGHVRLKSADPRARAGDPARTTCRRAADRRVAVDAIRLTRRIVLQSHAFAAIRAARNSAPAPS